MEAVLKRRLELLITLLVVGVVAAAVLIVVGAENVIPGTSNGYISVVKPPQTSQSPDQQAQQQAQYEARVKNFLAIANKDAYVHALIAGKNYTVVGIAILRSPPPSPGAPPIDSAALVVRVEGNFYKINIDIPHEKVISVEERICYGPACND
jgi:hypothetical protein